MNNIYQLRAKPVLVAETNISMVEACNKIINKLQPRVLLNVKPKHLLEVTKLFNANNWQMLVDTIVYDIKGDIVEISLSVTNDQLEAMVAK